MRAVDEGRMHGKLVACADTAYTTQHRIRRMQQALLTQLTECVLGAQLAYTSVHVK